MEEKKSVSNESPDIVEKCKEPHESPEELKELQKLTDPILQILMKEEVQKPENESSNDKSANLSEEELTEFYKNKCEKLNQEIKKYKDECSKKETENFELQSKIDELREIVDYSVEIKTNLEEMGVDVDKLLDQIDLDE